MNCIEVEVDFPCFTIQVNTGGAITIKNTEGTTIATPATSPYIVANGGCDISINGVFNQSVVVPAITTKAVNIVIPSISSVEIKNSDGDLIDTATSSPWVAPDEVINFVVNGVTETVTLPALVNHTINITI